MGKNKTPLIRPLRDYGATLYVFPSASEDIGMNINSTANGVALSHYALLNFTKGNFSIQDTTEMIKSLQNYAMNFETVLINEPSYNYQEAKTVSESVFWKWILKNKASGSEGFNLGQIKNDSPIYRESKFGTDENNRFVQCFGSIDAGNTLSTEFGMFNETYVNIPTSYGNGPVFFRKVTNNPNINESTQYPTDDAIASAGPGYDITYAQYRKINEGYDGIGTTAMYDSGQRYTENTCYELVKDISTIKSSLATVNYGKSSANPNQVEVTSYDDVNIDPDNRIYGADSVYYLNKTSKFNFNAILLYYSIFDMNDQFKQSISTNLFGIVFLNGEASNLAENYVIEPYVKKKSYSGSDSNNAYFGNSFSFRINIKTLSVYDNTDAVIQDNSTSNSAYSQDFNDVISNLNRAIDVMNTNMQTTLAIQDQYAKINAQYVEQNLKSAELEQELMIHNEEVISQAKKELTDYIEAEIDAVEQRIKDDLNIVTTDDGTTSSDGTVLGSPGNVSIKRVPYGIDKFGKNIYGEGSADGVYGLYVTDSDSGDLEIGDEDGNVLVRFDEGHIQTKNFDSRDVSPTYSADNPVLGSKSLDADDETTRNTVNAINPIEEALKAMGFITVKAILPPRAKKPETEGYYLKENTTGNIQNLTYFDGTEYTETVKCESGKMYSVNGLIYAFNGETCKLLGL